MGSSVDKYRHASKASDALNNLVWALSELVHIEEMAHETNLEEHLQSRPALFSDITARYVFMHRLINQVILLAMDNCKLRARVVDLEQQVRRVKSPLKKMEGEERLERRKLNFKTGLCAYDNARGAVNWLSKDFALAMSGVELELAAAAKQEQRRLALDLGKSTAGLEKELDGLEKRHAQNAIEAKAHADRLWSTVALHYLDRNFSGSVEPEDIPKLSAQLFNALDHSKDHKISADELHTAVTNSAKNIIAKQTEISATEATLVALQQDLEALDAKIEAEQGQEKKVQRTRLKQEEAKVKLMRREQHLLRLQQELLALEDNRDSVLRIFETGFFSEMACKVEALKADNNLPALLHQILHEDLMDNVNIGLAETRIKIALGVDGWLQASAPQEPEIIEVKEEKEVKEVEEPCTPTSATMSELPEKKELELEDSNETVPYEACAEEEELHASGVMAPPVASIKNVQDSRKDVQKSSKDVQDGHPNGIQEKKCAEASDIAEDVPVVVVMS